MRMIIWIIKKTVFCLILEDTLVQEEIFVQEDDLVPETRKRKLGAVQIS